MQKLTFIGRILNVLKYLHIDKLYKGIKRLLPNWFTGWVKTIGQKHLYVPLILKEEIEPKYQLAYQFLSKKIGREHIGDYLEFGVSHGTSMGCMHRVLRRLKLDHVRIFGFDSFEGMPEVTKNEGGGMWTPGQFASTLDETTRYLTKKGVDWRRTFLIKGWFSDTLTEDVLRRHNIKKASIIMIDCDIYSSSIQALNFCVPLIQDTAVIFFDDWFDDKEFGEHKAWEEFKGQHPQFQVTDFGSYIDTGKIFTVVNTFEKSLHPLERAAVPA